MISLDIHKILSQPSDEQKAQAVVDNIAELLGQYPENEIFSGTIAALVIQNLQMSEYIEQLSTVIQGICMMLQLPSYPMTFSVFVECRDLPKEQAQEKVKEYHDRIMQEIQARKKKIIVPGNNPDVNAMFNK